MKRHCPRGKAEKPFLELGGFEPEDMMPSFFTDRRFVAIARGFGWATLTSGAGMLGLVFYAIFTWLSKSNSWNWENVVQGGSLLLFSATLAAAVAVDFFFEVPRRSVAHSAARWVYLLGSIIVLYSESIYLFVYLLEPSDIDIAAATVAQLAALLAAFIYAICFKSLKFSRSASA